MAELVNFKSFLEISQVLGEEEQARIKAVLYGQCIGDAIGLLTEFLSKEEAKEVLYTIKIGSPMVCVVEYDFYPRNHEFSILKLDPWPESTILCDSFYHML